jgi:hypothetical protein
VKRRLSPLLCLVVLALAPGAAHAQGTTCGVPGDSAPKADIAGWMAQGAIAAALPGELPVMASLVESGLNNLPVGDRDGVGYFAMRVAIWNTGPYAGFPDHPSLQLQWFIDQALAVKRHRIAAGDVEFGRDASKWGEWIADVIRPPEQYRGRYQLRLDEARHLIAQGCAAPDSPPTVTLSVAPQAPVGQSGWLNAADGPATVSVSATDNSAVTDLACTADGAAVAVGGQTGANPRTGAFTVSADGAHAVACTATDSAGNTSEATTATMKLDRTPPTVGYTGNLGTYAVDAAVDIACSASDGLSGIDAAATRCASISGPAYRFAIGTNTFSASAADVAGNRASASTSFDVRVGVAGLCTLTTRFAQDSAAYRALPPAQRVAADRLAAALCRGLSLASHLAPAQQQALIRAYQAQVGALVGRGWLTSQQAAALQRLASAL